MSSKKIKYISSYNKENYKMYQFRVKKEDALISFLDSLKNRNSFIINSLLENNKSNIYTLKEIKQIIKPILSKYGINEIYLFGSYSRGEAKSTSDIDIYCEKGNIKTFIDQGLLEDELKEKLNKNVDIVFIGSQINDDFKKQMMEDLIKLC